jgi:outer membrane protein assembly factor BamB
MEEVSSAAIAKDGIYVATRGGPILKYSRDKTPTKPALIWKRPLDGNTEIPLCLGKNLFAVTNFGTLYAISLQDGHELWRYKAEGIPSVLGAHGDIMYLAMKEGRLLILNADQ